MKKIIIAVLVLIALLFIFNNKSQQNTSDKPIVKIGAILPITGRVSNLGEGAKNAITMAIEEVNSKPNNKYKYEVIFEDDQLENKKTALAAQKLINIDKAQALISYFSGAGLVVNPIAEQNKIIHFGETWHPDVANGNYNFIHFTQIAVQVDKYMELLKYLDIKKLAIITESRAGSIKNAELVREKTKNIDGLDTVSFSLFNKGEKQFTTLIEKAKAANPDYYYIQGLSPELEIIVRQMHDLGIPNEKISTIACFDTSPYKELFNGSYAVTISDYSGEFRNKYMKNYKIEPSYGTAFAYDIVNLIVYGFENSSIKDGDLLPDNYDVVNTIHNVKDFNSAVSEIKIYNKGVVHSNPTTRKVENGEMITFELKE